MNDQLKDLFITADLDELEKSNQEAYEMVIALCKPRGSPGAREWIMSIPARPDYDPDLIIGRALREAKRLLTVLRLELHRVYPPEVQAVIDAAKELQLEEDDHGWIRKDTVQKICSAVRNLKESEAKDETQ